VLQDCTLATATAAVQVYNRHDKYEWQQRITASLLQHWFMGKLVQQEPFEGAAVAAVYSFAINEGGCPLYGDGLWMGRVHAAAWGHELGKSCCCDRAQVAPACPSCSSRTRSPGTGCQVRAMLGLMMLTSPGHVKLLSAFEGADWQGLLCWSCRAGRLPAADRAQHQRGPWRAAHGRNTAIRCAGRTGEATR
jgi:hypothetical protein